MNTAFGKLASKGKDPLRTGMNYYNELTDFIVGANSRFDDSSFIANN